MLIASCFDGRIRIRDQRLTQKGVADVACEVLSAIPGISQVTINGRTGSLLIIYSAAVAKLQDIMETITGLFGVEQESPKARFGKEIPFVSGKQALGLSVRKAAVNMGMLASLLTSMIGILFGLKKLHVAAGILFLAFFGIHFFERRRTIFA